MNPRGGNFGDRSPFDVGMPPNNDDDDTTDTIFELVSGGVSQEVSTGCLEGRPFCSPAINSRNRRAHHFGVRVEIICHKIGMGTPFLDFIELCSPKKMLQNINGVLIAQDLWRLFPPAKGSLLGIQRKQMSDYIRTKLVYY